jgi:hypothetical protein
LGAALHAANVSDGIKMNRKLGMVDGVTYNILMEENAVASGAADLVDDKYVVAPRLKKIPSKVSLGTLLLLLVCVDIGLTAVMHLIVAELLQRPGIEVNKKHQRLQVLIVLCSS